MSARALVTGLTGFTGQYVARQLEELGYEVVGLGEAADGGHHGLDLRDAGRLTERVTALQPSVVVHLAAIAFVAHGDVSEMYTSNIVGTRNLLAALAACKKPPEKILLASSANVYGNATASILDEACPVQPENDYAVSKYAMELMARQWRDVLPVVIVRPFNYTGVGQSARFLMPKLVDHFARRAPRIELGNIDVYRDFNDVRVVAAAYAGLLRDGVAGEVYNVCSGRAYSIQDALGMLAQLAGYTIEVDVNPAFVRANEVKRLVGSNRKLAAATGEPELIPLADTLEWMYRAQIPA